jgi:hypothetical protein
MAKKRAERRSDAALVAALTKAYAARAQLFHTRVKASTIDLLIAEIDAIDASRLDWTATELGVSVESLERLRRAGGVPHQVFAHPDVITDRPHLIAYYRNIVTLSKKGISQVLFSTEKYESRQKEHLDRERSMSICQALNRIVSAVIEELPDYTVQLGRQALLAEIGAEIQGTWNNALGKGAAKEVKRIFTEYVTQRGIGSPTGKSLIELHNGWRIVFASEPDVAFLDADGIKRIAIEIKGSLDVNGAQTRYGEAMKTFAKQLADNPRCHTVYLASCFTDAVIAQIRDDGKVREWFNLTSILYDPSEKQRFLNRVFHIVQTPM